MARDPLYRDDAPFERLADDPQTGPRLVALQWAKLATGALALVLIAAIWIVWRWG